MTPHETLLECSFLIPERRDAILSDGELHAPETWEWLREELNSRFGGSTVAPGLQSGSYVDPDTKERVSDLSIKYTVAVAEAGLDELRGVLVAASVFFEQKCIYLSIAGRVEFIGPPHEPH